MIFEHPSIDHSEAMLQLSGNKTPKRLTDIVLGRLPQKPHHITTDITQSQIPSMHLTRSEHSYYNGHGTTCHDP